jgi:Flp pilus assembly protein TadD
VPAAGRLAGWRVELARGLLDGTPLDTAEAEELLRAALDDRPQEHELHTLLATALMKRQSLQEAVARFQLAESAMKGSPPNRDMLSGYGDCLNWLGRKGEARAVFGRMVKFSLPKLPVSHPSAERAPGAARDDPIGGAAHGIRRPPELSAPLTRPQAIP